MKKRMARDAQETVTSAAPMDDSHEAADTDEAAPEVSAALVGEGMTASPTAERTADPDAGELAEIAESMFRAAVEHAAAAEQAAAAERVAAAERAAAERAAAEVAAFQRAASEQAAAAEARERAIAERVEIAETLHKASLARTAAAEAREKAAVERAAAVEAREKAAVERDTIANSRDRAAAERDSILNTRDRAAAERETIQLSRHTAERDPAPDAIDDAALERARLEAELQRAHLDALTGAFRREMGRLALRNEIERARRADGKFVIAFIDVDGLKGVNDRDGHAAGDRVLRTLAATMRANLRPYDPIVRFGGDEFICGIASIDPDEVRHRIAVIDQSLRNATGVGITAGLAALTSTESLEELTEKADAALIAAKRSRGE